MSIKKVSKILALTAATVALAASLIADRKNKEVDKR